MTKFNIKNISEYRTLLESRSVAEIIRNRVSLRQTIDNYFNWLKDKYPTVASSLNSLLKQKELELNKTIDLQQEERIKVLIFDILEAPGVEKEIREQSRQRLDRLFTQSMPLDFQKVDKKPVEIENLEIDKQVYYNTSDVIFLVNGLIEEVFFNIIPRELEKELNQKPKLELSELPGEWTTKRDELLSSICAKSIVKVRDSSNLKSVEEAINEKCQELITIIQKIRVSKQKESDQELQKQHDELLNKARENVEKENTRLKQEIADLEQHKKSGSWGNGKGL